MAEDYKDIKSSVAYTILVELEREGKVPANKVDALKHKFAKLHEVVVTSFESEKLLMSKANELKQQLTDQQRQLETTTQAQTESAATLDRLSKNLEETSSELDKADQAVQASEWEVSQLEQDCQEATNLLHHREDAEKAKVQPEITRLENFLAELEAEKKDIKEKIIKETALKTELETKTQDINKDIDELRENQENISIKHNKEKAEPIRFTKQKKNLEKAIKSMEADLKKCDDETQILVEELTETTKRNEDKLAEIEELKNLITITKNEHEDLIKQCDYIKGQKSEQGDLERDFKGQLVKQGVEFNNINEKVRNQADTNQYLGKQLLKSKKDFKRTENIKKLLCSQLEDIENALGEVEMKKKILDEDKIRQKLVVQKLEQEQDIIRVKKTEQENVHGEKKRDVEDILKEIVVKEDEATQFRHEENECKKKMQFLAMQREQIARKASQNITQARETKEELKIKELLILDLTKKHQETESTLKNFAAMHEEVKTARNKKVKQIQNAAQELAEQKEKIKIFQNEVEILRNESTEKDRALKEARHSVSVYINSRDSLRADINKLEYTINQRNSNVAQQETESRKLQEIVNSIEKDMLELKQSYEAACESRNYTGIQLIDRNDELCILYEKSNIQENIQRKGEAEIRVKEDEIRMLDLELASIQRQIEVVRNQIPLVPELAQEVVNLNADLGEEREKEKDLAIKLEDPSNESRWRELKGEDPDQEALEAKIQVLEERLNNKKEALLEKELVLEEITNLADKLRQQALTGRQDTLELAEKVNNFQAKIKSLTRKMMATVSELSMFQATAMKLQQEKERSEGVLEEAYHRLDENQPPTDDCEKEWERLERNRMMRIDETRALQEREEEEKMAPGVVTRTTAEPRVNSYIPEDGTGLPKAYGSHKPFKPSSLGSNMRHIRKPIIKPIEI